MEKNKVIFIVEVNISADDTKLALKKLREARKAVKVGINSIEGVKAVRIVNKDV